MQLSAIGHVFYPFLIAESAAGCHVLVAMRQNSPRFSSAILSDHSIHIMRFLYSIEMENGRHRISTHKSPIVDT